MISKLDKQVYFVTQAMNQGITQNVALAAIWFRDNKAWKLDTASALSKFKEWVG